MVVAGCYQVQLISLDVCLKLGVTGSSTHLVVVVVVLPTNAAYTIKYEFGIHCRMLFNLHVPCSVLPDAVYTTNSAARTVHDRFISSR